MTESCQVSDVKCFLSRHLLLRKLTKMYFVIMDCSCIFYYWYLPCYIFVFYFVSSEISSSRRRPSTENERVCRHLCQSLGSSTCCVRTGKSTHRTYQFPSTDHVTWQCIEYTDQFCVVQSRSLYGKFGPQTFVPICRTLQLCQTVLVRFVLEQRFEFVFCWTAARRVPSARERSNDRKVDRYIHTDEGHRHWKAR